MYKSTKTLAKHTKQINQNKFKEDNARLGRRKTKLMLCAPVWEKQLNYRIVYAAWRNDGGVFESKTNSNEKNISTRR